MTSRDEWSEEQKLEDPYEIIRLQAEEIMALQRELVRARALLEEQRLWRKREQEGRARPPRMITDLKAPVPGQMEIR